MALAAPSDTSRESRAASRRRPALSPTPSRPRDSASGAPGAALCRLSSHHSSPPSPPLRVQVQAAVPNGVIVMKEHDQLLDGTAHHGLRKVLEQVRERDPHQVGILAPSLVAALPRLAVAGMVPLCVLAAFPPPLGWNPERAGAGLHHSAALTGSA